MKRTAKVVAFLTAMLTAILISGFTADKALAAGGNSRIVNALKGNPPVSKDILDKLYKPDSKALLSATTISSNVKLTSNKTYSGDVVIKGNVTYNVNGKVLTVNGDLTVYGELDLNGGQLKVNGNLTIAGGMVWVQGGSVVISKSSASSDDGNFINYLGYLAMSNANDKFIVTNGSYITAPDSSYGYLEAGTLDINGDFYQVYDPNSSGFSTSADLKFIVRGPSGTPRTVHFDTPNTSHISNWEFPTGTTFTDDSDISIYESLTADFTINIPDTLVYFQGSLGGHLLTANCGEFILTPGGSVYFRGGSILANCPSGFGEHCYVSMYDASSTYTANGDFIAASANADLQGGTLILYGDFTQLGSTTLGYDNRLSYLPGTQFTTKFTKAGTTVVFEDPDTCYFTNLVLDTGASFTKDSVIPIHHDLPQSGGEVTLDYPNLYYSGDLHGKTLTVEGDFTIGMNGINVDGGTLHALKNVTVNGQVRMCYAADTVTVEGNYTIKRNCYYYDYDLSAGTLTLNGNFITDTPAESFSSFRAFRATGTHKTILNGANKEVYFSSPVYSRFNDLEITDGTSFTANSVVSVARNLPCDRTYKVPKLYFAGGLNGHTLTVDGDLVLASQLTVNKGTLNVSGNLDITDNAEHTGGALIMSNEEDVVKVSGNFTAAGGPMTSLTKGTLYIGGNFSQMNTISASSFVAASPHKTVFNGNKKQTIQFTSAQSKFGILSIENPNTDFSSCTYSELIVPFLDLSAITVDGGCINPSISQGAYTYQAVVPKGTTSTTVHATKLDARSVITIDGTTADSLDYTAIPYHSSSKIQIVVSCDPCPVTHTYTLYLQQLNTDLSGIALSGGVLDTSFDPAQQNYSVEIPASVESVQFTPSLDNANSSCTVQGDSAFPKDVPIIPGQAKPVVIRVTGQDGTTTKDYTVTVHRAPLLDGINVSSGSVSPVFSFDSDAFTLTVPVSENTVTISPIKSEGCESFTIGGLSQNSTEVDLPQPGASDTIDIVAKAAESATTHTYHITVKREAIIFGFGQPGGATLSPAFNPTVYSYTITLPDTTTETTITPVLNSCCTELGIEVGDEGFQNFNTVKVSLGLGETKQITVQAKAGESITQTYTINVTRQPIISNIAVTGYTLSPSFSPLIQDYTVSVPATIYFAPLVYTKLSGTVNLDGGTGSIDPRIISAGQQRTIKITGVDGSVNIEYRVKIICTKPLSAISLTYKYGSNSAFNPNQSGVSLYIPSNVTSFSVKPLMDDSCSKLVIDGVERDWATLNPPYTYFYGSGPAIYNIDATDRDSGVVTHYKLVVSREAYVTSLYVSAGSLSPEYDASIDTYSVMLPADVPSVTISASDTDFCYPVQPLTLTVPPGGSATGTMHVYTTTSISYPITITAYRIAPITNITVENGTLSPAFSVTQQNYTVNVPVSTDSVTITPQTSGSYQAAAGDAIGAVTLNPIAGESQSATFKATAVNGAVFTYSVTASRAALLTGISVSGGALDAPFNVLTSSYNVNIAATVSSVKITPAKFKTGVKAIYINGKKATYLTVSPKIGETVPVKVKALASDGKTYSPEYTVNVTRAPLVTGIGLDAGSLSPVFTPTTLSYTVDLPADTTSVTVTPAKAYSSLALTNSSPTLKPAPGGSATTTITATADKKTKVTYTVTARRAPIVDSISVTGGTLSPAFSTGVYNYVVSLPATATGGVTISATPDTVCSTLTVGGDNANSKTVNPEFGETIKVEVVGSTAGGASVTYTIIVTRAALITKIAVGTKGVSLNQAFDPKVHSYTISTTAASVSISVTKASKGVKSLKINGKSATSFAAKPAVGGSVLVDIIATAFDGSTTAEYKITITRSAPLVNLTADAGTMAAFDPNTPSYALELPISTGSVILTPTANTGCTCTSDVTNTSGPVPLHLLPGESKTVKFTANAADKSNPIVYTVTVHRADAVTSINVNGKDLDLQAGKTDYTVNVGANINNSTITPYVADGCSFKITGEAYDATSTIVEPDVGRSATVEIVVTAGSDEIKYHVTVNRDASLDSLAASDSSGDLSLDVTFAAGTYEYAVVSHYHSESDSLSAVTIAAVGLGDTTVEYKQDDGTYTASAKPFAAPKPDGASQSVVYIRCTPAFTKAEIVYQVTITWVDDDAT